MTPDITDTTIRTTFRLTPELHAQASAYVEGRRSRDPKFSLNDLFLEAVDILTRRESPLGRYYLILKAGRLELRTAFSPAELNLIMDSCNGLALWYELSERPQVIIQPGRMIAANVEDSIRHNGLDKKWGVPRLGLSAKILDLSIPAQYALADLIERFWNDAGAQSAAALL